MDAAQFAAKWARNTRPERAAAQTHFNDLCGILGLPTPNEADPDGEWYAFEKGAKKLGGDDGFADVWKRGCFAWEYKGKKKNLAAAYEQLNRYREDLENPPILVVSDMDRFEVHTNFTNTKSETYSFCLADLVAAPGEPLRILRAAGHGRRICVLGSRRATRSPPRPPPNLPRRPVDFRNAGSTRSVSPTSWTA